MPLVSVLMPVYNGYEFLNQAVESILDQDYSDFELIIINDGSTDERVAQYFDNISDSRIKYITHPTNRGIVDALNTGLRICNGKYIARMDSDDIAERHRIKIQLDFMEKHQDVGVCGSYFKTLGDEGGLVRKPVTDYEIKKELFFSSPIPHPSAFIRRELLVKNGIEYIDESWPAEDYLLWVRMGNISKLANIPEPLLYYRTRRGSISDENVLLDQYAAATASLFCLACASEGWERMEVLLNIHGYSSLISHIVKCGSYISHGRRYIKSSNQYDVTQRKQIVRSIMQRMFKYNVVAVKYAGVRELMSAGVTPGKKYVLEYMMQRLSALI